MWKNLLSNFIEHFVEAAFVVSGLCLGVYLGFRFSASNWNFWFFVLGSALIMGAVGTLVAGKIDRLIHRR